jgi:hypothetical protein
MGLPLTMLKTTVFWLGFAWVVFIAAITLALTTIAKQGREVEREHELDERMGED